MASNQTEHYGLSQWERSDKVWMEDFNADNAKLDAALKSEADTRTAETAALAAQMARKGNCSVEVFHYTGNGLYGQDNPTLIRFRKKPAAFIIVGGLASVIGSDSKAQFSREIDNGYTNVVTLNLTWSGSTLKLSDSSYAQYQMNTKTVTYIVIAFYSES